MQARLVFILCEKNQHTLAAQQRGLLYGAAGDLQDNGEVTSKSRYRMPEAKQLELRVLFPN